MNPARLPGLVPGRRHPDWHKLYESVEETKLPWFFPDLDPDIRSELSGINAQGKRTLDVGCGLGNQAAALTRMGLTVTAIDISEAAIRRAKELHPGPTFLVDDITRTKLEGTFDFVVDRGCFHVLEPSTHADYLLSLSRLLAPGGLLIMKTFSREERDTGFGPVRFSLLEIHRSFGSLFAILKTRRTLYQGSTPKAPLSWLCVMRRRNHG